MTLANLKKGQVAEIASIVDHPLKTRLMEMGFLRGESVELLHEAPWGKDPIAVRVRGAVVALRKSQAEHILLKP